MPRVTNAVHPPPIPPPPSPPLRHRATPWTPQFMVSLPRLSLSLFLTLYLSLSHSLSAYAFLNLHPWMKYGSA